MHISFRVSSTNRTVSLLCLFSRPQDAKLTERATELQRGGGGTRRALRSQSREGGGEMSDENKPQERFPKCVLRH